MARNHSQHGERGGSGNEWIGERVSIFLKGRVWYANFQEGPKQKRTSLRTRNHDVARQKARTLEAELSGAVPRQTGTVNIDEEALKIYVHIADEQAQVTMRQLAERRQAAGPHAPEGGRASAHFQQSHGGQQ